ncbi:hypothetical protein LPB86_12105 [Pedobacter sp. MC2016-14]|uniref:XAC2610-related protein n=1 Tax=Pedobacter sp. MC2016-14 TaxID=2897327 RepID=UPI001E5BC9E0|nr:hypothetical protein [Pedobacter sp. MC2016-14]MCD0488974.1 hypothetical protein [Pedobacter sp. MC2016-14]
MIKKFLFVTFLTFMMSNANAQPFTLKSVGIAKEFRLKIYFGAEGKGAFVQYVGQKGIIPLRIKKYAVDSSERESGQPDFTTYVWDEVINGITTGSYGLTEGLRELTDIWYLRKKDGKRFLLQYVDEKPGAYSGDDSYLLHGVLLSFNHIKNNQLSFEYPGGTKKVVSLPDFDSPDYGRQGTIADYNFDGYDDVAFSIPDAGMGVYRTFSIWLYNAKSKRFEQLREPNDPRAKCSELCNVAIDKEKKLLFSSCRGAATWWKDVYRFGPDNKLVWIRSGKLKE